MDVIRASYVGESKEWLGDVEYSVIRDFAGTVQSKSDLFVQFLLEPMNFPNEEERVRTARFLLGFPINDFLRSGAVGLGHFPSDRQEEGDGNALDGFLILNKFDPKAKKSFLASVSSFWSSAMVYYQQTKKEGIPELFTKSSNRGLMTQFFKVAAATDKATKAWHIEFGPKEPHLHVCQAAGTSLSVVQKMLVRLVEVAGHKEAIFIGCVDDAQVAMLQEVLDFCVVGQGDVVDPTDQTRKVKVTFLVRTPPET